MAYPPSTVISGSNEALTKASTTSALEALLNEQCSFSWQNSLFLQWLNPVLAKHWLILWTLFKILPKGLEMTLILFL